MARIKRLEVLRKACKERQVSTLFFAHQAEDVVETFFQRLQRGSGIEGTNKT
jgi:tRNA(Ile)-lysidine synthase TilS/MesJ